MSENNIQERKLPSVAIVGTGNVATHLCLALDGKVELHQVNPHSFEGMSEFADIVVISVKDSAIEEVAGKLSGNFNVVCHTSGSVPMSVLSGCGKAHGAFYPLQTFTKGVTLDYSEIPFFIEGSTPEAVSSLSELAKKISENVREADSDSRKVLHLASVFACNFSNCLVGIADGLLKENGMDYRVLLPLLRQTIAKLDRLSPSEAQTGPAARLDYPIMDAHVKMLLDKGQSNLAEIYEDLSAEIINKTRNHKKP